MSPPLLPHVSTEVPPVAFSEDDFSGAAGAGSDEESPPVCPPSCSSFTGGAGPAGPSSRLAGFGGMYELADGGPLKWPALQALWTLPQ